MHLTHKRGLSNVVSTYNRGNTRRRQYYIRFIPDAQGIDSKCEISSIPVTLAFRDKRLPLFYVVNISGLQIFHSRYYSLRYWSFGTFIFNL